eukprot:1566746-Rhodomonas_salina.1
MARVRCLSASSPPRLLASSESRVCTPPSSHSHSSFQQNKPHFASLSLPARWHLETPYGAPRTRSRPGHLHSGRAAETAETAAETRSKSRPHREVLT